jgi:hypothetical protein
LNQEEIELESNDQSWSIGKLINDIQFFEKDTFENVYKRYHSEKDLETLFENAHKVLVNNKSIAEGVDFKQLEEVMGAKYLFFVFSCSFKLREHGFAQFVYFVRKVFVCFQFLKDEIHNYVKKTYFVNFIIQNLKNKHTFLKKYTH